MTKTQAMVAAQKTLLEDRNTRLELAMREMTHRFKNNLQILSALVELHALADGNSVPPEQLTQLRLHISCLGEIQELLMEDIRHDRLVGDISARSALLKLVPLLQRTVGAQTIELTADEVRLPINQGVSLALLVNELVSNAVKHGGRQISVRLVSADGDITLEVTDDGPGFVLPLDPRSRSTGMDLVEGLSRLDLGGAVVFNNNLRGGARVHITFPAPALTVV